MKNRYWILLLVLILVLCLGASLLMRPSDVPATHAEIRSGETHITVSLAEEQEFTFHSPDGGYNVVTVREGKIAVTEADCPDQYCVKQGFCNSGVQIVCLPHGLVISFVNDAGIDGAVG